MGFILLYFKMPLEPAPVLFLLLLSEAELNRKRQPGIGLTVPESSVVPSFSRELQFFPVCVTKSKTHQQQHTQARSLGELRAGREAGNHFIIAPALHMRQQPQGASTVRCKATGWGQGWLWVPSLWSCAFPHASLHLVSPKN